MRDEMYGKTIPLSEYEAMKRRIADLEAQRDDLAVALRFPAQIWRDWQPHRPDRHVPDRGFVDWLRQHYPFWTSVFTQAAAALARLEGQAVTDEDDCSDLIKGWQR